MARTSTVKRETSPVDQMTLEVAEYKALRDQVDALEKRKRALRDSLMETIKTVGEADPEGNLWLDLDAETAGVSRLQAERRVQRSINEERGLALLDERDLLDRCTVEVRVIDEDALLAARYEDLLTEEDLDSMVDEKVVWALKLK